MLSTCFLFFDFLSSASQVLVASSVESNNLSDGVKVTNKAVIVLLRFFVTVVRGHSTLVRDALDIVIIEM